tara:strand:+ start:170 stop:553 length:384 start_codon:yes stop_codon:yes gene_type:complete
MAKAKVETKTEEVKGPKLYWTAKEKEQLNNKYSTELIVENCNEEQRTNKYLPSDAYVVTYKHEKELRTDLVRAASRVNIFDMYYDKFGSSQLVSIEYGPGLMSPKLWGMEKPSKPRRRKKKIVGPEE